MAAFCGCCGAEITDRAEACPVCGTPRHGMIPAGFPNSLANPVGAACCMDETLADNNATLARED